MSSAAPISTAADYSLEYFFIVFQRKLDLIFHMIPLLAEDSHETSSLIFFDLAEDSHGTSSLIFFKR